jgi:hypothetical protein
MKKEGLEQNGQYSCAVPAERWHTGLVDELSD